MHKHYEVNTSIDDMVITVYNLRTKLTGRYNSISNFALDIKVDDALDIIPLMRFSGLFPILGRYIVEVEDYGSSDTVVDEYIYVLDATKGNGGLIRRYPNITTISYWTGVRIVDVKNSKKLESIGYSINKDKDKLTNTFNVNRKELLTNRANYLSSHAKSIKLKI